MKELTKGFAQLIAILIVTIAFALSTAAFSHWASSDTALTAGDVSASEVAQR